MKICSACHHSQSEGSFCSACGTAFSPIRKRTDVAVAPSAPNDTIIKLKRECKAFLSFIRNQCKSPTMHLTQSASGFSHSIFSIVLYILLVSIAGYSLLSEQLPGESVVTLLLKTSFLLLLLFAINVLSLAATTHVFSVPEKFTELARKLGGLYAIPILLAVIAILLLLLNTHNFIPILLTLSLVISFIIVPLYVVTVMLSLHSKTIDGFNGLLFYISCAIVLTSLCLFFISGTSIGEILQVFK